jgi:hypothetical protein
MPSVETRHALNGQPDPVRSAWERIEAHLENERRRVHDEIRKYPPPIPACDQDFNYLLEKRAQITDELGRLRETGMAGIAPEDSIKLIDEFVNASNCIDDEMKRKIRSDLKAGLARPATR